MKNNKYPKSEQQRAMRVLNGIFGLYLILQFGLAIASFFWPIHFIIVLSPTLSPIVLLALVWLRYLILPWGGSRVGNNKNNANGAKEKDM
jgi:hypothetical protein